MKVLKVMILIACLFLVVIYFKMVDNIRKEQIYQANFTKLKNNTSVMMVYASYVSYDENNEKHEWSGEWDGTSDAEEIKSFTQILTNEKNSLKSFTCENYPLRLKFYDENVKEFSTAYIAPDLNEFILEIGNLEEGNTSCFKYSLNGDLTKAFKNANIELISLLGLYCPPTKLIYEDNKYKYYGRCVDLNNEDIFFVTKGIRLNVREAIEKNYISIYKLSKLFPSYYIRENK